MVIARLYAKSEGVRTADGFVLLIVLSVLGFLALIIAQMVRDSQAAMWEARVMLHSARLQEEADGAVYEAIWHLLEGKEEKWTPGPLEKTLDVGTTHIVVTIEDERGKFDINLVSPAYMQTLLKILGAGDNNSVQVANEIAEWRSQPGLADTSVIERYKAAGLVWGPCGRGFQRIDELLLIQGMTTEVFNKAKPFLTLGLDQGPWMKYAGPTVAAAVAEAMADNNLPPPDVNPDGPIVMRIVAEASGEQATTFARHVLLRLDGRASGSPWHYRILAWGHGPADESDF